ncbi:hypothetical protein [Thalassobacillus sp. C254]|uniref:hypothetical protein n=1 Tax=Thalassobacillus sp. C254 TaxID=1225341 RepID=UPI0006D241C4|nr:hypothetical protein [Thalassobacillus sp. C254]
MAQSRLREIKEKVIQSQLRGVGNLLTPNEVTWLIEQAEKAGELEVQLGLQFNQWFNACLLVVGREKAHEILTHLPVFGESKKED